MALPATTDRVTKHTDPKRNQQIWNDMEHRLWYYLDHPEEIGQRLEDLAPLTPSLSPRERGIPR